MPWPGSSEKTASMESFQPLLRLSEEQLNPVAARPRVCRPQGRSLHLAPSVRVGRHFREYRLPLCIGRRCRRSLRSETSPGLRLKEVPWKNTRSNCPYLEAFRLLQYPKKCRAALASTLSDTTR